MACRPRHANPGEAAIDDSNIAGALWQLAEHRGERGAVAERGGAATYGELRARAAGVCLQLLSLGARPGDRVGMLLERGIQAVATYFGILASGAIAVVVNERLRPRQIEHILRHSSASLLLSSEALMQRQPRAIETTAMIAAVDAQPAMRDVPPAPRIASDIAQIIFTSGSTGLPKGVVVTHENLRQGARAVVSYLGLRQEDRIASLLPLSSVYGLNQLLCTLASGAMLLVDTSTLAAQIEATLREQQATVIAGVPPLWLQLLRTSHFADTPIPSLRIVQNAGGHLPTDTVRRLRAAQPQARLFLQYGLTEAFRSTYLVPEEVDRHPDSIGRAIPGAEILVVRDDLSACDIGEVGELVHRGPTVAAGYWNDPDATERVFRPNPLRPMGTPCSERVVFSGDLVRRDADGLLYFVGRRDRMIKSLGYRVAPDEVADVLFHSGEILEAVVAGEPDAERGERVVAYVVMSPGGSLERLDVFCRRELPRHMQPCRYEVRASLPRLGGGKYDLAALLATPVD
jgi:amino acid adenylation domain-containing protein